MVKNYTTTLEGSTIAGCKIIARGNSTKRKWECPRCNQKGKYSRYVNVDTLEYAPYEFGKCDRPSCGYHSVPNGNREYSFTPTPRPTPAPPPKLTTNALPSALVAELLTNDYKKNNLYAALLRIFGAWNENTIKSIFEAYRVGTVGYGYLEGATVYFQCDVTGQCRGGKIIKYDSTRCKRDKSVNPTWVHSHYKSRIPETYELKQCLFGAHLLNLESNRDKPVLVVEAEKTALVIALHPFYYRNFVVIATGGANSNLENLRALYNREVWLAPDYDTGGWNWTAKVKQDILPNANLWEWTNECQHLLTNKCDVADVILQLVAQRHGVELNW